MLTGAGRLFLLGGYSNVDSLGPDFLASTTGASLKVLFLITQDSLRRCCLGQSGLHQALTALAAVVGHGLFQARLSWILGVIVPAGVEPSIIGGCHGVSRSFLNKWLGGGLLPPNPDAALLRLPVK